MGGIGVLAVTAALAGTPPPASRVEIDVGANIGYVENRLVADAHTLSGGTGLRLTIFVPRPVVDDDAPRSLQPFLQRAGRVWMGAAGGGFHWDYDGYGIVHRVRSGAGAAGFDVYAHPFVALTGSFTVSGSHSDADVLFPAMDLLGLQGTIGLGIRWQDVRFDLEYRLSESRAGTQWSTPHYGNVSLSAFIAVQRHLTISLMVETVYRGAQTWAAVTKYLGKDLSLFLGIGGGQSGAGFSKPRNSAHGEVGFTGWRSRHFAVTVSYSLAWTADHQHDDLSHVLALTFSSRAR
jgi:hypothetical protein